MAVQPDHDPCQRTTVMDDQKVQTRTLSDQDRRSGDDRRSGRDRRAGGERRSGLGFRPDPDRREIPEGDRRRVDERRTPR